MPTHTIKAGDTKPLRVRLLRESGAPIELEGAQVAIVMKDAYGSLIVDHVLCDVVDLDQALVEHAWADGETAKVGVYRVTFPVTDAAGDVETIPNKGALDLVIE
jgi:hypothetical protein